jgi:hypothetical protein
MKKIACFFAVAACVACSYDVCEVSGEDQAGKSSGGISVTLEFESELTKASGDYLESLSVEDRINRVDVLVFDRQTGDLNASKAVTGVDDPCQFSVTTGEKVIYAVANAPDLSNILNVSQLEQVVNDLSTTDYRNDGFMMVGSSGCQVRLGEVAEPVINLKRMVARVVIKKMKNKFASQFGSITVDCMFLANANMVQTLGGVSSQPVNVGGYADASKTMPIGKNGVTGECPLYMFRQLGIVIPEGATKSDVNYMYCHPTNDEAKTCVYLLLTVAGNKCYYRVPLLDGLQSNKTYTIELEFLNRGPALPPDGDLQKGDIKAVVTVSGWDAGKSYSVIF